MEDWSKLTCKIKSAIQVVTPHSSLATTLPSTNMPRSEASIDDISSNASYDSEEEYRLAQQEWEESLQQLQQLVSVVMLPFFGKWLGRRWSHWGQPCMFCIFLRVNIRVNSIYAISSSWSRESFFGGVISSTLNRMKCEDYGRSID